MKIAIANGKDFWAGVMFVAFGLAFMIVAQNYSMGTAVRMGPAYFPTVLGGMLAILGGIILFESFVTKNKHAWRAFTFRPLQFIGGLILGVVAYYTQAFFHGFGLPGEAAHTILSGAAIFLLFAAFGERSLWIVLFAVVLFGYLLKPLGLVLAIGALVYVSAWGGHEFKVKEATILFVALAIFSVASFVHGLGLPMNVWPSLWE